jgi:D-sedoheptulose 7-phosphate isomerase
MNFTNLYFKEIVKIIELIDHNKIERIVDILFRLRSDGGRLFFLGVGGSAGNCSHAVNDFRKIVNIESYTPTDNVSELTARVNDEGWETVFYNWLKVSKLSSKDILFVFSVGGGDLEQNISPNIVSAIKYGKSLGCKILGIVGKENGYTAKIADECVIIPIVNTDNITPHAEEFQAIIWHLLVTHPKLKINETKWESVRK